MTAVRTGVMTAVMTAAITAIITAAITAVPGGCDSSRLVLSVPNWRAEAATAADLKGGLGGRSPPGKSLNFFVIVPQTVLATEGF